MNFQDFIQDGELLAAAGVAPSTSKAYSSAWKQYESIVPDPEVPTVSKLLGYIS